MKCARAPSLRAGSSRPAGRPHSTRFRSDSATTSSARGTTRVHSVRWRVPRRRRGRRPGLPVLAAGRSTVAGSGSRQCDGSRHASTRSEHGILGKRRRKPRSPAAHDPIPPGCRPDERFPPRPSGTWWSDAVRVRGSRAQRRVRRNCEGPAHNAARGGDPEVVRDSIRKRFGDPAIVDKVIELDAAWREGKKRFFFFNRLFNYDLLSLHPPFFLSRPTQPPTPPPPFHTQPRKRPRRSPWSSTPSTTRSASS